MLHRTALVSSQLQLMTQQVTDMTPMPADLSVVVRTPTFSQTAKATVSPSVSVGYA
jgi:hypothetical protein